MQTFPSSRTPMCSGPEPGNRTRKHLSTLWKGCTVEVPCPRNTETWIQKGLQEADLPRLRVVPTRCWYELALKTPNITHTAVFLKAKSRNSATKIFHLKKFVVNVLWFKLHWFLLDLSHWSWKTTDRYSFYNYMFYILEELSLLVFYFPA